jgi:DNA-binding CsgD family transcriptional regulator
MPANGDQSDESERIALESRILSRTNAEKHAVFTVDRNRPVPVERLSSTIDRQVEARIVDMLGDKTSAASGCLANARLPYTWIPCEPGGLKPPASNASPSVSGVMEDVRFHMLFRHVSVDADIVLLAQAIAGSDALDESRLLAAQGLAQALFDQILIARRSSATPPPSPLTARERECLHWCAEGKTSEDISVILGLSAHTVNHYLTNATKKLDAVNRLHAVTIAYKRGLLGGPFIVPVP